MNLCRCFNERPKLKRQGTAAVQKLRHKMGFRCIRASLRRLLCWVEVAALVFGGLIQASGAEVPPQRVNREEQGRSLVFKERITPFWFHENTRFWYRNDLRGDTKEFI